MADAKAEKTTVKIDVSQAKTGFTAIGEVIKEPGFLLAYGIDPKKAKLESQEDDEADTQSDSQGLPPITS